MGDARPCAVGLDVGGTFTDMVLVTRDGTLHTGKQLTDTGDPARGARAAFEATLDRASVAPVEVDVVTHGTTLAANAVVERGGARTALITTAGFEDVLAIGRETQWDMFALGAQRAEPLIAANMRLGVDERTDASGHRLRDVDVVEAEGLAAQLDDLGAESVAVCLLHAHRDPTNERRLREVLWAMAPSRPVSISSEIDPELGEFERTLTTVVNAYVTPLVERYLRAFESGLHASGFRGRLRVMLSSGGTSDVDTVLSRPVQLLESGPAAAVLRASRVASELGEGQALAVDIGGTTAKLCAVSKDGPTNSTHTEIARQDRFRRNSGLTVNLPTVDLVEVGAGGGSIGHVNRFGLLSVGPRSAGATPGPACYGRDGSEPTATDACLVLGSLSPTSSLAAKVPFAPERGRAAMRSLADDLGLSVPAAAARLHALLVENMASAAREYLLERGQTPERHTLVATGGAAGLHAFALARAIGCRTVILPPGTGVDSALGLLDAPSRFDMLEDASVLLDDLDGQQAEAVLGRLTEQAVHRVSADVGADQPTVDLACSMRHRGQRDTLDVSVPRIGPTLADELGARYLEAYQRRFGTVTPEAPIEVVAWKVTARLASQPVLIASPGGRATSTPEAVGHVLLVGIDGDEIPAPVHRRSDLPVGARLAGPMVVEDDGATILVPSDADAEVDDAGNLIMRAGSTHRRREAPLEVLWARLIAVANEQAYTVVSTAFSPLVRDGEDTSAAILDRRGRMLAQADVGSPGHINSMATCAEKVFEVIDPNTLVEGDVVVTNDPEIASGHKNDILLLTPAFGSSGALLGFVTMDAHTLDIGGVPWSATASDIYEEGLSLPPTLLMRAGVFDEMLVSIIRANVRQADLFISDLQAFVGASLQAAERLRCSMEELGRENLETVGDEILDRSRTAVENAIAAWPAESSSFSVDLDGCGTPLRLCARISVGPAGVAVDFDGSSPQQPRGINSPLNYTTAYAAWAVKAAIFPFVPNNAASVGAVRVHAPVGSVLHARHPAAVGGRQVVGGSIGPCVLGALAGLRADAVAAAGCDLPWTMACRGTTDSGRQFSFHWFLSGGIGATASSPGASAVVFPARVRGIPLEQLEADAPIRFITRRLRQGSGGRGAQRGGDGQVVEFTLPACHDVVILPLFEHLDHPPHGLGGGETGACGHASIAGHPIDGKSAASVAAGAIVRLETPGGGGVGRPPRDN